MNPENHQTVVKSAGKSSIFRSLEIKGLSHKSAKAFTTGRAAKILRSVSRLLAFTPARVYGLMFLSFGILTLFLHLGEYYFLNDPAVNFSSLVIGAVFALLSLFLIPLEKPICIALQSFAVTDFLLFEFFSINRMQPSDSEHKLSGAVGIIFGSLLSVFGFFLPTEYAALLIVGFLFVTVAMVSPEFPYIFSLLIFPYLSLIPGLDLFFVILIALTVISFARKVLIGKRIYSFGIYDVLFAVFILVTLISGVILGGDGSSRESLFVMVFALGYIPASNLSINRRLFDCVSGAIVASSIPVSLYSVIRYVIDLIFYERASSRAFFSSPEILAVFLVTSAIFALYLSIKRTRNVKKRYYFSAFSLSILAILTTECYAIVIAFLLLLLSGATLRKRKVPVYLLIPILLVPILTLFVGNTVLSAVSNFLNIEPSLPARVDMLRTSLAEFFSNFFFGLGLGEGSESLLGSCNLYLGIALSLGIFAICVLILLVILRVFHLGIYKKYFSDSEVNFYVEISTLVLVAILVLGSYFNVFADIEMIYFFVAIFATGSAALRVSHKEKLERHSYYKDLGTSDSAAIDLFLK